MVKRYYWLKLHKDFFGSIRIKKLRSIAGGDTYTIIYLKLLLHTIDTDGVIEYQGVEKSISEELAWAINENAEDVGLCLNYLQSVGLAEIDGNTLFLPEASENVGSENASSQRVREYRTRQKALHCNADVTQCNASETQVKRLCNVEKRREEKEIDKSKRIKNIPSPDGEEQPEIMTDDEVWFEEFWKKYPKKVDKIPAKRAFKKKCVNESEFQTIMQGLNSWLKVWKEPQFIPYPSKWLNNERYREDPMTTQEAEADPYAFLPFH